MEEPHLLAGIHAQVPPDVMVCPTTHYSELCSRVLFRDAGIGDVWVQFLAIAAIGTVLSRRDDSFPCDIPVIVFAQPFLWIRSAKPSMIFVYFYISIS